MLKLYIVEVEYTVDDPIEDEAYIAIYYVLARTKERAIELVKQDLQKSKVFVAYNDKMNPILAQIKDIHIENIKEINEEKIIYVF